MVSHIAVVSLEGVPRQFLVQNHCVQRVLLDFIRKFSDTSHWVVLECDILLVLFHARFRPVCLLNKKTRLCVENVICEIYDS